MQRGTLVLCLVCKLAVTENLGYFLSMSVADHLKIFLQLTDIKANI